MNNESNSRHGDLGPMQPHLAIVHSHRVNGLFDGVAVGDGSLQLLVALNVFKVRHLDELSFRWWWR